MRMQYTLVSHPLCPYTQRCVITLLKKGLQRGVDFDVTYVDLAALPAWFFALSPSGSMPALSIAAPTGSDVLLEPQVINEYLNESTSGDLHTADPLRRAKDRYWIEYANKPLNLMRDVYIAKDADGVTAAVNAMFASLAPIEPQLEAEPHFFRNNAFSLVDGTYAPLFKLMLQFEVVQQAAQWRQLPKTRAWAQHLLADSSVIASACPAYAREFEHFFKTFGSYFPHMVRV
jgi:glutathione S-transferase